MKKALLGIVLFIVAAFSAAFASAAQYVDYRDGYDCYGAGCTYYRDHYVYRVHYPVYGGYYGGYPSGYGGYYYPAPSYGYYAPYYNYYNGYPCNYGGGSYWWANRYRHYDC